MGSADEGLKNVQTRFEEIKVKDDDTKAAKKGVASKKKKKKKVIEK